MAGRKPKTKLNQLRTASTFSLLLEIYAARSASELGRKLYDTKAIDHADPEASTRHWVAGRRCLKESAIRNIAMETAKYTNTPNLESLILNHYFSGPDEIFRALSGQKVSYYVSGPTTIFQSIVLALYQLALPDSVLINKPELRIYVEEWLQNRKGISGHLSTLWFKESIMEHLRNKAPTFDEAFEKNLKAVIAGESPNRLRGHLACDDKQFS